MNRISIHQLIEQQVIETPEAIAVVFQNDSLTYQALNQQANQLAHYLKALGVKTEMLVGVCVERSIETVITLLGILKAGAAYVPLDPTYPKERLAVTIEDAQLPFVITQQHLIDVIPKNKAEIILVEQAAQAIDRQPQTNLNVAVCDRNLAYVLYTSGSTGKPKGVAIEHRNTLALIEWASQTYTAYQLKGVLASTSLCFDLSVFEIFVTLSCGGKVIVVKNALDVPNLVSPTDVTLINTVPSAINELLRLNCIPPSVETINLAGEPLQNALVQQLYQLGHVDRVYNLYGPSEDTTYSTAFLVPRGSNNIPSIGKPISNTKIYLLDAEMKLVPTGTEGEIHISGPGLARGYLNRPELTAQKFITCPFSQNDSQTESRLYKTGDLAAYDSDGNLKFFGRIDNQVKIRGFRIELGEIESYLLEHYAINQVIVVAREGISGSKSVIAYIVPKKLLQQQHTLTRNTLSRVLRAFLGQKLPDYMVPSAFILLDQLPLTLNGKIDRRALPVPSVTRSEAGKYVAPKTSIERKLAEIWGSILEVEVEKIGVRDSFEEFGGNSLLSVRVVSEVNEKLEAKISLNDFLEAPEIEHFSKKIEAVLSGSTIPTVSDDIDSDAFLNCNIFPQQSMSKSVPELLLTGASGFLGTFLLSDLLTQTRADVHCLVRASSVEEGKARLQSQLKQHNLWREDLVERIFPVIGDLSLPMLGLTEAKFFRLSEKIDAIYHCGAWVNVIYPYSALKAANVKGTEEILKLACQGQIKPVHFISTVDVYSFVQETELRTVSEKDAIGPGNQLCSGYAQSKYVAEKLVIAAGERGLPVSIYRPSNILGSHKASTFPIDSFVIKMLQGCLHMEAAPEIEALLNIVPVDYVSRAVVTLSQQPSSLGRSMNITNPQPVRWSDLLEMAADIGYPVKRLTYESWYADLLKVESRTTNNMLAPLAALFSNRQFIQKSLGAFNFACSSTHQKLSAQGVSCPPVEPQFIKACIADLARQQFLKTRPITREQAVTAQSHKQ